MNNYTKSAVLEKTRQESQQPQQIRPTTINSTHTNPYNRHHYHQHLHQHNSDQLHCTTCQYAPTDLSSLAEMSATAPMLGLSCGTTDSPLSSNLTKPGQNYCSISKRAQKNQLPLYPRLSLHFCNPPFPNHSSFPSNISTRADVQEPSQRYDHNSTPHQFNPISPPQFHSSLIHQNPLLLNPISACGDLPGSPSSNSGQNSKIIPRRAHPPVDLVTRSVESNQTGPHLPDSVATQPPIPLQSNTMLDIQAIQQQQSLGTVKPLCQMAIIASPQPSTKTENWSPEVIVERIFELLFGYLEHLEYSTLSPQQPIETDHLPGQMAPLISATGYSTPTSSVIAPSQNRPDSTSGFGKNMNNYKNVTAPTHVLVFDINSMFKSSIMSAITLHPNRSIRNTLNNSIPAAVNIYLPPQSPLTNSSNGVLNARTPRHQQQQQQQNRPRSTFRSPNQLPSSASILSPLQFHRNRNVEAPTTILLPFLNNSIFIASQTSTSSSTLHPANNTNSTTTLPSTSTTLGTQLTSTNQMLSPSSLTGGLILPPEGLPSLQSRNTYSAVSSSSKLSLNDMVFDTDKMPNKRLAVDNTDFSLLFTQQGSVAWYYHLYDAVHHSPIPPQTKTPPHQLSQLSNINTPTSNQLGLGFDFSRVNRNGNQTGQYDGENCFTWDLINNLPNKYYLYKMQHPNVFVPHPHHDDILPGLNLLDSQIGIKRNKMTKGRIETLNKTLKILTIPQLFLYFKIYQTSIYQDSTYGIIWYLLNNVPNPSAVDLASILQRLTQITPLTPSQQQFQHFTTATAAAAAATHQQPPINDLHGQRKNNNTIIIGPQFASKPSVAPKRSLSAPIQSVSIEIHSQFPFPSLSAVNPLLQTNHLHQNILSHALLHRWNKESLLILLHALVNLTLTPIDFINSGVFPSDYKAFVSIFDEALPSYQAQHGFVNNDTDEEKDRGTPFTRLDQNRTDMTKKPQLTGLFWLFSHRDSNSYNIIKFLEDACIWHYAPEVYIYITSAYKHYNQFISAWDITFISTKDYNPYLTSSHLGTYFSDKETESLRNSSVLNTHLDPSAKPPQNTLLIDDMGPSAVLSAGYKLEKEISASASPAVSGRMGLNEYQSSDNNANSGSGSPSVAVLRQGMNNFAASKHPPLSKLQSRPNDGKTISKYSLRQQEVAVKKKLLSSRDNPNFPRLIRQSDRPPNYHPHLSNIDDITVSSPSKSQQPHQQLAAGQCPHAKLHGNHVNHYLTIYPGFDPSSGLSFPIPASSTAQIINTNPKISNNDQNISHTYEHLFRLTQSVLIKSIFERTK